MKKLTSTPEKAIADALMEYSLQTGIPLKNISCCANHAWKESMDIALNMAKQNYLSELKTGFLVNQWLTNECRPWECSTGYRHAYTVAKNILLASDCKWDECPPLELYV